MNNYLIGIDAGTTSIKGILVDDQGRQLAFSVKEYQLETPSGEICELNPEIYWINTVRIIKELIQEGGVDSSEIRGLAISSQGETMICVDKVGKPLRKAIVWLDNRSWKEAKRISRDMGNDHLLMVTGQPEILPIWPATRIFWLQKNEPDNFQKIHKFLMVEDFLIYKLTDRYITEKSVSSSTLYMDIIHQSWWKEMLDYLNIEETQLPELYESGKLAGNITQHAARVTGLSTELKVITGAYDHPAGAIGAGNLMEGMVTETTGAAMAMVCTLNRPVIKKELNLPCQIHAVPGKYLLLPYGQTAGMVLKWFREQFALEETKKAGQKKINVYDLLDKEAEKAPAGADGLIMLPHLMGTGSPEFNAQAKGVFAGIGLHTKKSHFVRAIMESVAYMIRKNIESLNDSGVPVTKMITLGGGSRSDLWNQIKADITGIPVSTMHTNESSSLGAAILAGVGSGVFEDLDQGCRKMVRTKYSYTPNSKISKVYNRMYLRYLRLYELLMPYWKL